jgi:hypothetical protein
MIANESFKLALGDEPVFLRKLTDFLCDYGIDEQPAFVWQCQPGQPIEVDLASPALVEAMRLGARSSSSSGWWYGFRSESGCVPVFGGLSATNPPDADGWSVEVHSDGHVIAGLWDFPDDQSGQTQQKCIAEFHADAFRDFGQYSAHLAEVIAPQGQFRMTASLLRAPTLRAVNRRSHRPPRQCRREVLQWRVRAGGLSDLITIGSAMTDDYTRAFWFR